MGIAGSTGTDHLLADIRAETVLTSAMTGIRALSPAVLAAVARVPRDRFVPERVRHAAYDNGPLPIGHGQTISQPFVVALMTELLRPGPRMRVLEVGTGCGYQTAILAQLCREVYSIEVVAALGLAARTRLQRLGFDNVVTRIGNGYLGWPEHAPYDGILVTAAAPYVPPALLEQLVAGGRLVIPIGAPGDAQTLQVIDKGHGGDTRTRAALPVAFVPLVDHTPTAEPDGG